MGIILMQISVKWRLASKYTITLSAVVVNSSQMKTEVQIKAADNTCTQAQ